MKLSLVPLLAILTLAFGVFITAKAKKDRSISRAEARSVYFLVIALAVWTVILIALESVGPMWRSWIRSPYCGRPVFRSRSFSSILSSPEICGVPCTVSHPALHHIGWSFSKLSVSGRWAG